MTKIFGYVTLVFKRIGGFFKKMFNSFVKTFFFIPPMLACPIFTMTATIDAFKMKMTTMDALGVFAVMVGFYWFYSALYSYRKYLEKREIEAEKNRLKKFYHQS